MEKSFEKLFGKRKPPSEFIKPEAVRQKEKELYLKTPEEEELETKKIKEEGKKELKGGVNKVFHIEFEDGSLGIFKPKSGEAFARTETLPSFKRERASYLIDRFLGFNLVPPTVIREIDGEEGSLQQFIPDADVYVKGKLNKLELINLGLFDYIIFNRDRHYGNLLLKGNKIYAVDNGLTFTKIREVGGDFIRHYPDVVKIADIVFCDTPIPKETRERLESFLSNKEKKEILRNLLLKLLAPEEVEACFKRMEKVGQFAKKGKIEATDLLKEMTFE